MKPYSPAEARLAVLLNVIAVIAAILMLVVLIFGSATQVDPALCVGSAVALFTAALLSWLAAADLRRFRAMIGVLGAGLILCLLVTASIFTSTLSQPVQLPALIFIVLFLIGAGVLTVRKLRAIFRHSPLPLLPGMPGDPLTLIENVVRLLCGVGGVVLFTNVITPVIAVMLTEDLTLAGGNAVLLELSTATLLLSAGAIIAFTMLSLCMIVVAANIRRHVDMMTVIILGCIASLLFTVMVSIRQPSANLGGVALASAICFAVFWGFKIAVNHATVPPLKYLSPAQFRAFEAICETLIEGGASEKVSPYVMTTRLDEYTSQIRSKRLWITRLAIMAINLLPLLWLWPPMTFLDPALRRRFIDYHFKKEIIASRGIYWLLNRPSLSSVTDTLEGAMRFMSQLSYIGYYSDPAVYQSVGYVPFSKRPEGKHPHIVRRHAPLKVLTPDDLRQQKIETINAPDVVIIGSGAAGAILAEQLVEKGHHVTILEKGPYVRPDDFTEDEVSQMSRLYGDGAFQMSRSMRFNAVQGYCVGGSTVVNNAVCFDTPPDVLDRWQTQGGLNLTDFRAAQEAVKKRMQVQSIVDSSSTRPWQKVLNPAGAVIEKGVHAKYKADEAEWGVVSANILDCLGCGYCNMGCKFGRKLSMLDEVLPSIQEKYPDQIRIISEAEVTNLKNDRGKITEITVDIGDGKQKLTITNPAKVILSAGAIGSSWILMRSGIGKGTLPVGQNLCFNMGTPLHAWYGHKIDAYAGLQIGHYLEFPKQTSFVFETWYNPPMSQALVMPGWLDSHFHNMRRYSEILAFGVVVGTQPGASIAPSTLTRGLPDLLYKPLQSDLDLLVKALEIAGDILFASGAKEVFASTRSYKAFKQGKATRRPGDSIDDLQKLIKNDADVMLASAHPQGGNSLGLSGKDGVVNPDFKVFGFDNLYVCDASVFPSATTVNPQLSVMTMAHYAAQRITES